jgi:hypothetical protein
MRCEIKNDLLRHRYCDFYWRPLEQSGVRVGTHWGDASHVGVGEMSELVSNSNLFTKGHGYSRAINLLCMGGGRFC